MWDSGRPRARMPPNPINHLERAGFSCSLEFLRRRCRAPSECMPWNRPCWRGCTKREGLVRCSQAVRRTPKTILWRVTSSAFSEWIMTELAKRGEAWGQLGVDQSALPSCFISYAPTKTLPCNSPLIRSSTVRFRLPRGSADVTENCAGLSVSGPRGINPKSRINRVRVSYCVGPALSPRSTIRT
jgi:hypothetical protein